MEKMDTIQLNQVISILSKAGAIETDEISDTYHTFGELYHHRAILTAALFSLNKHICWKSKLHDDFTMFPGYFIVGMSTDEGNATYHYPLKYWDIFDIPEKDRAPEHDGYTAEDAILRIQHQFLK